MGKTTLKVEKYPHPLLQPLMKVFLALSRRLHLRLTFHPVLNVQTFSNCYVLSIRICIFYSFIYPEFNGDEMMNRKKRKQMAKETSQGGGRGEIKE